MRLETNSHYGSIGTGWRSLERAVTRNLCPLTLLVILVANISPPAAGQSQVPPTARQAATMPQYSARLAQAAQMRSQQNASHAYPSQSRASHRNALDPRPRNYRGGPLDEGTIYENGPINGTTDAWTINSGFVVSDTLTIPSGEGSVNGMIFGAWAFPGDVLQSVQVSITSSEFGGTTYFDGVVNFTQSGCSGNQYGFNVCTETSGNFGPVNIAAGTYWVNLANASVSTGDPIYWDENSGIGCTSPGCPSLASETSIGTIPSEAFTILGNSTTTTCYPNCPPECVHDEDNLTVVHNFTGEDGSPASGLAIDYAGNLYGATVSGGTHGEGSDYKLSPWNSWIFNPLFNFSGGAGGQNPTSGALGPDGALYGAADGGLQTCGNSGNEYCGVVYRLRPPPTACLTALCGWNETVLYQFTGAPNGWQPNGNVVFDKAGNLYGTTLSGGAHGLGTVYELSPSNGDWTEQVIYSFIASDGDGPNSLLIGSDGNLYGSTFVGGHGGGVVFQLVNYGGVWAEQVIASFASCSSYYGCSPLLATEKSGTLYGVDPYDVYLCPPIVGCLWNEYATVFSLARSNVGGWRGNVLDDTRYYWYGNWEDPGGYDLYYDVRVDAAANVYAAEGGFDAGFGVYYWGHIIKVAGLGQDQFLVGFNGNNFRDLEIDAGGNLYGTTASCGTSEGTVWQLAPP